MTLDRNKLRAAIQYICWVCEPHELGKVKLHKTLWHADFAAYRSKGAPITGESYKKDKFGPVAGHLDEALKSLAGFVAVSRDDETNAWVYDSPTPPAEDSLSDAERAFLDAAIQYVCREHTAASISAESHDRIWEIASKGEEIPYFASLASQLAEIEPSDISWARSVLGEHK